MKQSPRELIKFIILFWLTGTLYILFNELCPGKLSLTDLDPPLGTVIDLDPENVIDPDPGNGTGRGQGIDTDPDHVTGLPDTNTEQGNP